MRRILLAAVALGLGGCGAREALAPPPGQADAVAPYAAKEPPKSDALLAPQVQTRPARSDDLIESSEERRSDEYDLPAQVRPDGSFFLARGELHAEDVPLSAIAEAVGTPVYVYSTATLERHARVFREAVAQAGRTHVASRSRPIPTSRCCACSPTRASAPTSSPAASWRARWRQEWRRARSSSRASARRADELVMGSMSTSASSTSSSRRKRGAFRAGGGARHPRAGNAQRSTPMSTPAGTHAKISTGLAENKFGLPIDQAPAIFDRLAPLPGLNLRGLAVHIGSQLQDLAPLEAAFERMGALVTRLRAAGHAITHVDLGGGLGVPIRAGDSPPDPAEYGAMVARVTRGWDVELMFEPGRVIAANAGVLLTRVLWVKPGVTSPWVIVDAAMNDLARVALYDAWHDFAAVRPSGKKFVANVAGPVCESSDVFAKAREIDMVKAGDLAVLRTAGAYGASMASTYNSRALVPEVLVSGDRFEVVARRIAAETIMGEETVPDWLA